MINRYWSMSVRTAVPQIACFMSCLVAASSPAAPQLPQDAARPPTPVEGPVIGVVEAVGEARGVAIPAARLQPAVQRLEALPRAADVDDRGVTLIKKSEAEWKYWDRADDPGAAWANPDFDDQAWPAGAGPLGYGDQHIKTKVGFGDDANEKHLVVFFRHSFALEDPATAPHLAGAILCDDAAAVYVNGKEVYRRNLPDGELTLSTRASAAISGDQEKNYWEFLIDGKLLRKGTNTIAVRIHQTNQTSSDLGFDFELRSIAPQVAERMARRLAGRPAVQPAVAAAAPQRVVRSFTHLTDGEIDYVGPDGMPHKQRVDAVEQAKSYVPSAKFVRMIQGDTLAKLAAQHGVDAKKLALLNRTVAEKVYAAPDVACVSWTHRVQPGETLASLAHLYNSTTETLAELNSLGSADALEPGGSISVPGEFSYHYRRSGYSYLRLARYTNPERQVPYDQRSMKMRREQLDEDQTLADLAEELSLTEDFLRQMNGLAKDQEPTSRRWLLVEYSVELSEGATLAELAQFFGVPLERLLEVNQLADVAAFEPGQRFEIPIGDRFENEREGGPGPGSEVQVFEVTLQADAP